MELIEALAEAGDGLEALKRVDQAAPANCEYLTVLMPPFKTYADQRVIRGLKNLGWRVIGFQDRSVFLQRTPVDLPSGISGV